MNPIRYKNTKAKIFLCRCGKAKHICIRGPGGFDNDEKYTFKKLKAKGYKSKVIYLRNARKLKLCFSCIN